MRAQRSPSGTTVYPRGAEKALQRDFDISESTAERVLRGQASQPIINQMLARWGWRFASFVLEPVCGRPDNLEIAHRIEATERLAREALNEASALRQEIAAQVGIGPQPRRGDRDPVRHVDAEDRPQADAVADRVAESGAHTPAPYARGEREGRDSAATLLKAMTAESERRQRRAAR